MKKINQRQVEFDCEDIFPKRWSPRSLSPEVTKEDLMKCFEAARWSRKVAQYGYPAYQIWAFEFALYNGGSNMNQSLGRKIRIMG